MNQTNLKQIWQQIRLIHLAIFSSLTFFLLISTFLVSSQTFDMAFDAEIKYVFIALSVVAVLAALFVSNKIYTDDLSKIPKDSDDEYQLTAYRQATIKKVAILEAGGTMAVVFFFLSGELALAAPIIVAMGALWLSRPTIDKLEKELNLKSQTIKQLK